MARRGVHRPFAIGAAIALVAACADSSSTGGGAGEGDAPAVDSRPRAPTARSCAAPGVNSLVLVEEVSPATGPIEGGAEITIRGLGFTTGAYVFVGAAFAPGVRVLDRRTIKARVPPSPLARAADVVVSAGGAAGCLPGGYTYFVPLAVSACAPGRVLTEGGDRVRISGTGFGEDARVLVGGREADDVRREEDGSLAFTAPEGAPGAADVRVTTDDETAVFAACVEYVDRLELTSVRPLRGPPEGGTRIALSGLGLSRFTSGRSRVLVGGAPATDVAVAGDDRLTATTPPGAAGPADVTVENDNGAVTLAGGFTYASPPVVAAVEPATLDAAGGTPFVVRGSGFVAGSTVSVAGASAIAPVAAPDGASIAAIAPAGTPGPADLRVANANGVALAAAAVTYVESPAVDACRPAVGPLAGGTDVFVAGAGLDADAASLEVLFGGVPATAVSPVNAHRLVATAPAGAAPGPVVVTVRTPRGEATAAGCFAYLPAGDALALVAVSPAAGPPEGGTPVTLHGNFASGVEGASIGGAPLAGLRVESATEATGRTPPGPLGAADVTVRAPDGAEATLAAAFTYEPALAPTAIFPVEGPVEGGTAVVVTGAGFGPATRVFFGPLEATNVSVHDVGDAIDATSPPGAPGPATVTLRDGARVATVPGGFVYRRAVALYDVAPSRAAWSGGAVATLVGEAFAEGATVRFGDAVSPSVQGSGALLVARVPRSEVRGTVAVTVTNPDGAQAALEGAFTYYDPTAPFGGTGGGPPEGAVNATVIDGAADAPLPGALVIVAPPGADADPATTPFGITDDRGQVTIPLPPGAPTRFDVTAAATGHAPVTYVQVSASDVTFFLTPNAGSPGFPGGGGPQSDATVTGVVRGLDHKFMPYPREGVERLLIRVRATQRDLFRSNPPPGDGANLHAEGPYTLASRAGDQAVYAIAGIETIESGLFRPFVMGVRRHVFVEPGATLAGQDVWLAVPLDATLSAEVVDAPLDVPFPRGTGMDALAVFPFVDLDADGIISEFSGAAAPPDEPRARLRGLPRLGGQLDPDTGASLTLYAQASSPTGSPNAVAIADGITTYDETALIEGMPGAIRLVDPIDGGRARDQTLATDVTCCRDPSFAYFLLYDEGGAPVWDVIMAPRAGGFRLPDVAAFGLPDPIPRGQIVSHSVLAPAVRDAFSIDAFTYRALSSRAWLGWSSSRFDLRY